MMLPNCIMAAPSIVNQMREYSASSECLMSAYWEHSFGGRPFYLGHFSTLSLMDKVLYSVSRVVHYSEVHLYSASVH